MGLIVERHGAHRGSEDRQVHRAAEQGEGGVHRLVLADGVHVDAQLLPLLIVTDEAGPDALVLFDRYCAILVKRTTYRINCGKRKKIILYIVYGSKRYDICYKERWYERRV